MQAKPRGVFDEIIVKGDNVRLMKLAVAASFAVPATVLTATDAYAQTQGMERRDDRQDNRTDRRDDRRRRKKEKVVWSCDDQGCEDVWR